MSPVDHMIANPTITIPEIKCHGPTPKRSSSDELSFDPEDIFSGGMISGTKI